MNRQQLSQQCNFQNFVLSIVTFSYTFQQWISILMLFVALFPMSLQKKPSNLNYHINDGNGDITEDKSLYKYRSYSGAILFPGTVVSSTAQHSDSSTGSIPPSQLAFHQCITSDGKVGTCSSTDVCLEKGVLSIIHKVAECGFQNGVRLICCPEIFNKIDIPFPSVSDSSTTPPPKVHSEDETEIPEAQHQEKQPASLVPASPIAGNNLQKNNNLSLRSVLQESTSSPEDLNDLFNTDEVQQVCGALDIHSSNHRKEADRNENEQNGPLWPWIVSIGRKHKDGSINWRCLGTLISREFILTTAHCVQRNPNVVAVEEAILGFMSLERSLQKQNNIHQVSSVEFNEKFTQSLAYQNIGIVQLESPVTVNSRRIPVCFPFLASVLDIIAFVGFRARTIAFDMTSRSLNNDDEIKLDFQEYAILNNSYCSRIFNTQRSQTVKRFPQGIKGDNMCGQAQNPSSLCQAPGAPLVIYDDPSESYVIIGISTGDPTCNELNREVVTFTRINAFSSWVHDRVRKLPKPTTCYVN